MSIYTMVPFLRKIVAMIMAVAMQAAAAQARAEISSIMEKGVYTPRDAMEDGFSKEDVEAIDWSAERRQFIVATIADGASLAAAEDAAEQMFGVGE